MSLLVIMVSRPTPGKMMMVWLLFNEARKEMK